MVLLEKVKTVLFETDLNSRVIVISRKVIDDQITIHVETKLGRMLPEYRLKSFSGPAEFVAWRDGVSSIHDPVAKRLSDLFIDLHRGYSVTQQINCVVTDIVLH